MFPLILGKKNKLIKEKSHLHFIMVRVLESLLTKTLEQKQNRYKHSNKTTNNTIISYLTQRITKNTQHRVKQKNETNEKPVQT